MPPLTKACACGCGERFEIPHKGARKKYFNDQCRDRAAKRRKAVLKRGGRGTSALTPAMQAFRELQDSDDEYIREVLQDVVRDEVTEYVQDKILGAGEIMANLLPRALASLADDLENGDDYLRAKARDLVLKYGFDLGKRDAKEADFAQINIMTALPIPDTPLGRATAEQIVQIEEDDAVRELEAFEKDWPKCSHCGERRHPDTLHAIGGTSRGRYCSSCFIARERGRRKAGGDDE